MALNIAGLFWLSRNRAYGKYWYYCCLRGQGGRRFSLGLKLARMQRGFKNTKFTLKGRAQRRHPIAAKSIIKMKAPYHGAYKTSPTRGLCAAPPLATSCQRFGCGGPPGLCWLLAVRPRGRWGMHLPVARVSDKAGALVRFQRHRAPWQAPTQPQKV